MKLYLPVIVLVVAGATPAVAQRGELDAVPSTPRETSRLDGFPGTFNAAMPAPREWRLELGLTPSLGYGIHDEAAVSVSFLPALAWFAGGPGAGGELRYRVWHDRRFAVVGSFGGLAFRRDVPGSMTSGSMSVRSVKATLTGEWRYSHRSALAFTVVAGGALIEINEHLDDSSMAPVKSGGSLEGIGVMASYSFFPASWFGFDLGLGIAPRLEAVAFGTGGSQSVDLDALVEATLGLGGRFMLYVKPGRSWLIHLGAVVLPPAVPVPLLGVSKRW
jgi:hypothetical protein